MLTCLGITVTVASSCGMLGDKKAASRTLAQESGACLDQLGPLTEQYLDGKVDSAVWGATWDCVDDTIDLFKKFVKGSEATGYSAADIKTLMQKFLFTKPVSSRLVEGALAVKSTVFGGTTASLTTAQLDSFRAFAKFLKSETLVLLPHLKNRKENPTPANMRAFADAVETFGNHFADYLQVDNNPKLTKDMAVQFVGELAAISAHADPAKVEQWTLFFQEIKVLLVRGATDGITGPDLKKILRFGFKAGGAFIAYLDLQGEDPLFQMEMIDRIHNVVKGSMTDWGGSLPFAQLEKIVNQTPKAMLPPLADDFKTGMVALFNPRKVTASNGTVTTFRPAIARLLQSHSDTGIDTFAVQYLVDTFRKGMRANSHLNAIYGGMKESLAPTVFESRALTYSTPLSTAEKAEVARLITIAKRYPGLHQNNSPEILFASQDKHSINNLKRMNWYELAASALLDTYGSTTNTYGKAGTLADLNLLIADLNPLLYSFGMVHPKKKDVVGAKRFREANLFMPNGNGDDLMDLPETAVYVAFLVSSGNQTARVMSTGITGAPSCPMLGWNVPLKIPVYDVHCFRQRFIGNFADLMVNMPKLMDDYNSMTQTQKDKFYEVLEYSSKTTGYNDDPVTEFDMSSYAGLPHFAESVMAKFDKNKDGSLDRSETLNYVFPIFKRELATLSGIKIDFVNKAALLYLMQYGKQPGTMDLVKWALGLEFLKAFNARRARVFEIFAALGPPIEGDPISQTPPPGVEAPLNTPMGFISSSMLLGLTPASSVETYAAQPQSNPLATQSEFDLSTVDPNQLKGYANDGKPVIDPNSPYKEALEVLPQDL